jgi:hypothetical protein
MKTNFKSSDIFIQCDRLCGLVVRVPGYRSRGSGSISFSTKDFVNPLSLVSTIEELLERKGSCYGIENRKYGCKNPGHWPLGILYQQKLALTSPTSSGLEFFLVV